MNYNDVTHLSSDRLVDVRSAALRGPRNTFHHVVVLPQLQLALLRSDIPYPDSLESKSEKGSLETNILPSTDFIL